MASTVDLSLAIPQLPAEVWRMVLGHFNYTDQDLIHLWLHCRLVSRLFKAEVEHTFAQEFVSETSLLISSTTPTRHGGVLATEKLSVSWWNGLTYSGSFTFERFSEHGDQAIFRCDSPLGRRSGILFQALKDQELLRNVMKKPCYEVRIRQRVNHVPLPNLLVDAKECTLALDWRQLFSRFLGKESKDFVAKRDQVSSTSDSIVYMYNHRQGYRPG